MIGPDLQGTIGILGGTFDPVHIGHLLLAEQALEQFGLSKVCWIPAAVAPHAEPKKSTQQNHRLEMVRLATSGNPRFFVDDRELCRGGHSYTVETLAELHKEFPAVNWILLMGADSLANFGQWREPQRICQLAQVVVVTRGGQPLPDFEMLKKFHPSERCADNFVEQHWLSMPQIEISSSDIRRRIQNGRSVRYMVPPAVEAYINAQGLYQNPESDRCE